MPAARRNRKGLGRRYGIVAASLGVHAALVALVAVQTPRLKIPEIVSGPPEPIIPVLILPRTPPPAAAAPGAKPTPIRLHRRPQRFVTEPLPIPPLVAPTREEPAERAAPTPGPRTMPLPTSRDPIAENARNALRSRAGCDNPALTRAEREACMERFAAGGRDAPFLGLGVDRDKATALDAAARRREADYRYKRSLPGPPVPVPPGAGYDLQRSPPAGDKNKGMGVTSEDLGATPLKVPF